MKELKITTNVRVYQYDELVEEDKILVDKAKAMHSKYPEAKFEKLAIAAKKDGKFTSCPVSPCGACRQSILEYETLGKQPVKIYLYGDDGIYVVDRVADLLPLHFDSF